MLKFSVLALFTVLLCFLKPHEAAVLGCSSSSSAASSVGKYWGESQECVAGVKYFCSWASVSSLSFTAGAKKGVKVLDNCSSIAKHTAIATFENAGKYQGHAAIFISCDKAKNQINVYDQWAGRPWNSRTIQTVNAPSVSNDPTKFYVVNY